MNFKQSFLSQKLKKTEEEINILVLKSIALAYADLAYEHHKDADGEVWFDIVKRVRKSLMKRKAEALSTADMEKANKKYEKLKKLDSKYFNEKNSSFFIQMVTIIDYLIKEKNEKEFIKLFKYFINTEDIFEQLEKTKQLAEVTRDSHRFLTEVIGELEK